MPGLPGRSAFGGFVRETGGNVLILFALCLPLVILAVGAAVDFGRGADAQVKIQSALDAAALAGAKAISQGETDKDEVEKIAKATFDANLADNIRVFDETPTLTVDIDSDAGTLKVSSKSKVDHVFSVLGTDKSSVVGATSTAAFNSLNIELAMMLDVTGSMGGQKIADLKSAASSVVDMLMGSGSGWSSNVRISLVPYSAAVNAGAYAKKASNGKSDQCVVERVGTDKATDVGPDTAPVDFVSYAACPNSKVLPLSGNASQLKTRINKLSVDGCTAGHIGVAWSYYTLSPHWASVFPAPSQPGPYKDPDKLKVALLMTDGLFNTYYHGANQGACKDGTPAADESAKLALDLCKSMRDDGIVIYSVAYQAPSDAQTMLKACATDDEHYFETDTGSELIAAFQEVADNIRDLRLTR